MHNVRKGAVSKGEDRSLTVAARCVCADDEPSTINGGAARLALQMRNIVLEILANEAEMRKKIFGGTIFQFVGVARLALQTRSARPRPLSIALPLQKPAQIVQLHAIDHVF